MALDVSEAIKTGFGSLKTGVGQKLAGIFLVLQLLNIGSTALASSGTTGAVLGLVLSLVAAVAGIAATIGGLRSFRNGSIKVEYFTSNLAWPFVRTLGANLTTAGFAYVLGAIFLVPAYLAVLGGISTTALMTGTMTGLGNIGMAAIGMAVVGAILGIAAFSWVVITLILAQPLIAIDDRRMFQALDESVQRTKNNKLRIFLVGLVVFILYALAIGISGAAGSIAGPQIGTYLAQLVGATVFTPVFLALLNHFTEELPRP